MDRENGKRKDSIITSQICSDNFGEMGKYMKKAILILTILIAIMFYVCSTAETETQDMQNEDYAEQLLPEGSTREVCPPIDDSWLMEDTDMLLLMKALRNWYYEDTKREELFLEGRYVLIVNPYIFKVNSSQQHKRVYCVCNFDEYWLYSDSKMQNYLCLGWNMYQAFTVDFVSCKGRWTVDSISIPQKDEKLIPGWGIGTQGMNGVSDEMIEKMNENNYTGDTEKLAQKYLERAHLNDARIIFE